MTERKLDNGPTNIKLSSAPKRSWNKPWELLVKYLLKWERSLFLSAQEKASLKNMKKLKELSSSNPRKLLNSWTLLLPLENPVWPKLKFSRTSLNQWISWLLCSKKVGRMLNPSTSKEPWLDLTGFMVDCYLNKHLYPHLYIYLLPGFGGLKLFNSGYIELFYEIEIMIYIGVYIYMGVWGEARQSGGSGEARSSGVHNLCQ